MLIFLNTFLLQSIWTHFHSHEWKASTLLFCHGIIQHVLRFNGLSQAASQNLGTFVGHLSMVAECNNIINTLFYCSRLTMTHKAQNEMWELVCLLNDCNDMAVNKFPVSCNNHRSILFKHWTLEIELLLSRYAEKMFACVCVCLCVCGIGGLVEMIHSNDKGRNENAVAVLWKIHLCWFQVMSSSSLHVTTGSMNTTEFLTSSVQ